MEDKTRINPFTTESQSHRENIKSYLPLNTLKTLNKGYFNISLSVPSVISVAKYILFSLCLCVSVVCCGFAGTAFAQQNDLDQQVNAFELTEYKQDGSKKFDLAGERADIIGDKAHLTNVSLTSYAENTPITFYANNGVFNKESQEVYTDNRIHIDRDDVRITGKGASARPDLKYVQLKEDVEAKIGIPTTITCDGPAELDHEKNHVKFYNKVVAEDEYGKIFADSMDVTINPEANSVEKVIAVGNVRIERGSDTTYSERAEYIAGEGRIILTGRPKLVIFPK